MFQKDAFCRLELKNGLTGLKNRCFLSESDDFLKFFSTFFPKVFLFRFFTRGRYMKGGCAFLAKQEGIKMSENDYQLKIQRQFESYCVKAIRNRARELKRNNAERYLHEYHLEDLPLYEQEKIEIGNLPEEGSEIYLADGMVFSKDDLYKAIELLPEKSINIIQLHYFGNLTDSQIGELLKLSRRMTTYHRNRALDQIRKSLKDLKNGNE